MAHTDKMTDGHRNSMTDPAQRAKPVKRSQLCSVNQLVNHSILTMLGHSLAETNRQSNLIAPNIDIVSLDK